MKKKYLPMVVIMLILGLSSYYKKPHAFASSSDWVDATLKINVCGDLIAEGGEECDNNDLKGKNCTDLGLGFRSGVLACDPSCTFDTTNCSTKTISDQANDLQVLEQTQLPIPIDSSLNTFIDTVVDFLTPSIPIALLRYTTLNITQAAGDWVASWNSQVVDECDLNEDRTCDLADFSILMYYAEE